MKRLINILLLSIVMIAGIYAAPLSKPKSIKINVIGVPLSMGCDRDGVETGPAVLRNNGLVDALGKTGHKVVDMGDIQVIKVASEDKYKINPKVKYFDAIIDVNTRLANKTEDAIKDGALPFVVGGDHSVALGSISGVSACYDNLGAVWIDAHGDINTPETSPSGNTHGMPMAALMGFGPDSMVNLHHKGRKIEPQDVCWIGTRDLDRGEVELIEEQNLSVYYMNSVNKIGVTNVTESIKQKFKAQGIKNLHISLDIDSLDPQFAPEQGPMWQAV